MDVPYVEPLAGDGSLSRPAAGVLFDHVVRGSLTGTARIVGPLAVVQLLADDLANADAMLAAVKRELSGLVTTTDQHDTFVFYDPGQVTVPERRFPFLTLVTGDRYDAASDLNRDQATYRGDLGVDRQTYEHFLGPAPRQAVGTGVIDTGTDYSASDVVLPHPFYAPIHWVCIVNPGTRTRPHLLELLERAHALAQRQYDNRHRH